MKKYDSSPDRLQTEAGSAELMSPHFHPLPESSKLDTASPATRTDSPRLRGLRDSVERARDALLEMQAEDGHWVFEFEADCTIPAEYVLMMHFLDEIDEQLQRKLANYIRERQGNDGGWPLYLGGSMDLSCSVKAYWALKLAGDPTDAQHMTRAREAILERGGAALSNGFTRSLLARFGQVPWRAVPFTPVEMMLLPRWLPFHYSKFSYWSRAVVVPLAILHSLRAQAVNPTGIDVQELFTRPPEEVRRFGQTRSRLNRAFLFLEGTLRRLEPFIPGFVRRRAIRRAEQWFVARLNGVHGLGGVFPSMVNALEAMVLLGYEKDHPLRTTAAEALRRLVIEREDTAYCQPCVSPVWDVALSILALHETRGGLGSDVRIDEALNGAGQWLADHQQLDGPADWRQSRPKLPPGGWPFQYANDYYPDIDDTSAVLWALERANARKFAYSIQRGLDWVRGMQSSNGGFAAFDVDNNMYFLLELPVGDSGPLLDPPTADVSARCATAFAILGRSEDRRALARCTNYLLGEQEENGSWFGRWGTNYIYGTWCAMMALEQLNDEPRVVRARERAVAWLESVQREDGSWGESNASYEDESLAGRGQDGTSYQTAWALLALMAAGRAHTPTVQRGIAWLLSHQLPGGTWHDPWYSAPGFPRVFYLRYTGYSVYFPLWAIARYLRHVGQPG